MAAKRSKRLAPECAAFLAEQMEKWPRTTEELQEMCQERGFQKPTYTQIRRIELSLWRGVSREEK